MVLLPIQITMQQGIFTVQITCPQCHGEREYVPVCWTFVSVFSLKDLFEFQDNPLNCFLLFSISCIFFFFFFIQVIIPVSLYYLQPQYICKSCKGKRVVSGTKSVKLNIMPGISFSNLKIFRPWWLYCWKFIQWLSYFVSLLFNEGTPSAILYSKLLHTKSNA